MRVLSRNAMLVERIENITDLNFIRSSILYGVRKSPLFIVKIVNQPARVRHNIMAIKKTTEDDDFDEPVDDSIDEYEELEFKKTSRKRSSNARRRHEQLKEDRALERLLSGDLDYFEDYNDYHCCSVNKKEII